MIMEYRNKKNGAVINVDSELGGDWEPVKAPAAPVQKETEPAKKTNRKRGTVKK